MQNKKDLEILKKTYGSIRFRFSIQKLKTIDGHKTLIDHSNLTFYTADPYFTVRTIRKHILKCLKSKSNAKIYFFE